MQLCIYTALQFGEHWGAKMVPEFHFVLLWPWTCTDLLELSIQKLKVKPSWTVLSCHQSPCLRVAVPMQSVRIQPSTSNRAEIKLACKSDSFTSSAIQMKLCATVNSQICIFMKNVKNLKNFTATINSYRHICFTSDVQIYAVRLHESSWGAQVPRAECVKNHSTKAMHQGTTETRKKERKWNLNNILGRNDFFVYLQN